MASALYGDWKKFDRLLKAGPALLKKNAKAVSARNASFLRDQIRRTLRDGRPEWPPLSPLTSSSKKSTKPLMNYGDLQAAVVDAKIGAMLYFVGVPPKNKMAMIATVQEYGATIRPRKARALTVPVSREASELIRKHRGIRNIPGLFRPKNTRVLALPKGGGFEIMFILMARTVIPARAFVEPTFNDNKKRLLRNWDTAIRATLRGQLYAA